MNKSRLKLDNPLVNHSDLEDHIGVGAIIEKEDGRILMLHHLKYDFWTIPIGKCSPQEMFENAIIRELQEELAIVVENEHVKFKGEFFKTYDRGYGIQTNIEQRIYEIDKYWGTVTNCEKEKHDKMGWFTIRKIESMYEKISDMTKFALVLKS